MRDDITTLTQTPHRDAPACAEGAEAETSQAETSQDWARRLLERQLWVLGQLAEGGLEIARAIERQATQSQAPQSQAIKGEAIKGEATGSPEAEPVREVVRGDLPLAYARVARAVRMTILLQSKLIGELQALDRLAAHDAQCARMRADIARPGLQRQLKARVQRIVGRIAEADGDDARDVERLVREAAERLDQDDIHGDVLSRPVSEIIARICQDLGLDPDWPALAQEAWAQGEINSGAAGSPLAALMAQGRPVAGRVATAPQAASP